MAKVGGEVDAFCTRCQLLLAHTVIAMVGAVPVKVECNTCRNVHRFRGASTVAKRTATRSPRAGAKVSFEEMLAGQSGEARRYAPSVLFASGDVLDHATFGRGFVSGVKDPGKVEVTFRTGVKTLVHGKR
ncbi:MAG: hypothetical protein H6Q88_2707 [Anaeromyxobacteraceae bacterium]|jgi:hypothetical protein|nr:hypothetical protein [Anaeromyxobacteraceae bacterium]